MNYKADEFWFAESNAQYQERIKEQFGGLKDKYFSLFKKAVSFTPITNIEQFLTEYVCDVPSEINVDSMRNNIQQYKRLELEAENMQVKINKLNHLPLRTRQGRRPPVQRMVPADTSMCVCQQASGKHASGTHPHEPSRRNAFHGLLEHAHGFAHRHSGSERLGRYSSLWWLHGLEAACRERYTGRPRLPPMQHLRQSSMQTSRHGVHEPHQARTDH